MLGNHLLLSVGRQDNWRNSSDVDINSVPLCTDMFIGLVLKVYWAIRSWSFLSAWTIQVVHCQTSLNLDNDKQYWLCFLPEVPRYFKTLLQKQLFVSAGSLPLPPPPPPLLLLFLRFCCFHCNLPFVLQILRHNFTHWKINAHFVSR